MGTYAEGPRDHHASWPAVLPRSRGGDDHVSTGGSISQITGDQGQQLAAYELEPLLITGLSDANRSKRRLVTYDELPHNLVNAVVAIEDRRFFPHGGVDYFRLVGAARNDLSHRTPTWKAARR